MRRGGPRSGRPAYRVSYQNRVVEVERVHESREVGDSVLDGVAGLRSVRPAVRASVVRHHVVVVGEVLRQRSPAPTVVVEAVGHDQRRAVAGSVVPEVDAVRANGVGGPLLGEVHGIASRIGRINVLGVLEGRSGSWVTQGSCETSIYSLRTHMYVY